MLTARLAYTSALAILALVAGAGCSSAAPEEDVASAEDSQALGKVHTIDQSFRVGHHEIPVQRIFQETLTRGGVTVTPSFGARGDFALDDANIHVEAEYVAWPAPSVHRIALSASADWTAAARVDLDVTADAKWSADADFRRSFVAGTSLGGKAFQVASVPLAVFPLPNAPSVQLEIDLELAIACSLDFDAELHASVELGVGGRASIDAYYDRARQPKIGFDVMGDETREDALHVTKPLHVAFEEGNQATVRGRCSLQPSLGAKVALGVNPAASLADAGVKVILEPYVEIDGTFAGPRDWSVQAKAGVQGNVSPFGDFAGHRWEPATYLTMFDWELTRSKATSE